MKKLTFLASALAALFLAASCQQELHEPVAQESTVSFSVELPGVQTKAIGDGLNVDQLVYEVWKTDNAEERNLWNAETATRLYQQTATMATIGGEQKTVITLNLVHDQNYTILFWAQNSKAIDQNPAYVTDDLRAVTYAKSVTDGSYLSNNENMAAFYNVAFLKAEEVETPSTRRVELKRPFAQLNIATVNTPEEYNVTVNKSKVQISNVPTVFDVAKNVVATPTTEAVSGVSEPLSFVYEYAAVPTDPATITVNNQTYDYVAMNYIFASDNVKVEYWIDATLTATDPLTGNNATATADDVVIYNEVPEVPLKENYRTNIVGNLLSSNTSYEVVIDASWDDVNDSELNGDGYLVEVWDGGYIQKPYYNAEEDQYEISLASELAWLAAAVNGKLPATKADFEEPQTFAGETFVLMEDIDLTGALWNPIGSVKGSNREQYSMNFKGTFDGQGHVIKNMTVENAEVAGLFGYMTNGTVKNVTIDGFNLKANHYAGAIVGWVEEGKSVVTVDGCTVKNGQIDLSVVESDLGDKAGAIVGFAHGGIYTDNIVDGVVINGYRDLGGVAGCLQSDGNVINNTVKNSKITADQTPVYAEVKAANVGKVVGRINSEDVTIEGNEAENVEAIAIVDSVDEIMSAQSEDDTPIFINEGQYVFEEKLDVEGSSLQVSAGNNVVLNAEGNDIVAGSASNYGLVVSGEGASLVIENANIDSKGGAIGATDGAEVTVKSGKIEVNTKSTSGRYLIYAVGEGTVVNVEGGEYSWDPTLNQKRAYIYAGAGATVYVKGGTFGKASTRAGYTAGIMGDGTVIITGGTFGFDPTNWLAAGYTVEKVDANWVVVPPAFTAETLQEAITNAVDGDVIYIGSDITGDVTVTQKENVKITIDGQGYKYSGVITVDGKSATYTTAGLTIKDLNFAAESISADACIRLGDGTNATRYTCNVTVDNCTFDVPGAVGVKSYTGGDKNLTITGCTATNKAHSLIQAKGIDGILIEKSFVYSKNGMNFNNSTNVVVDQCETDVTGYAARFGESSGGSGTAEVYEIKNSTLKSANGDGDAVIILRGSADYSTLTITNTTLDGTPQIKNTAADAKVIIDGYTAVTSDDALAAALAAKVEKIGLLPGTYNVNLYDIEERETLQIKGSEGTKVAFKNLQVRASQFKNLTIDNCEILRMPDKKWGHLVFGSGTKADGVYTVSNCTFNGVGSQGIYVNENTSGATYNITGCTFNNDFGSEGAVTIQNNENVNVTVNVSVCTFNDIPETSNKIYIIYPYKGLTLNTDFDVPAHDVESLRALVGMGKSVVSLKDGNYELPSLSDVNLTIKGTRNAVITINKPNYTGSDVTFEGVTVKGSGVYTGVQHVNNATYNNVKVVGDMCLYGEKVQFNTCEFELNNQYIWTYGADEAEFNTCTFNTTGKAILVYNEGDGASKVTVKGCTFNATASAMAAAIANQNCAAIEIDNSQKSGVGAAHEVITENNKNISDNFSGEWRIKNYVAGAPVTVNGVQYKQIALDGKLMTIDASKNVTLL